MSEKNDRPYDLIVYGAASFVGRLLVRYLIERHGTDGELKWALAGRSQAKIESVANEFDAQSLPVIIADAADEAALDQMASQARVIVSTVGPYALYGSPLVAACVKHGTDYCDLTGEPQWMRLMIDQHHDAAVASGARMVHNCGFDSIPSDLGTAFIQQESEREFGEPCSQVKLRVKAMKGGASGGTVASLINVMKEIKKDRNLVKVLQNPYSVCPPDARSGVRQKNVGAPEFDQDANAWLAPFVMAGINTKVVHRSNAVREHAWGKEFLYDEAMQIGDGMGGLMKAGAVSGGLGGFMALAIFGPTRAVLERFVLPAPGEGPSPEEQEKGFFDIRLYGRTAGGSKLVCKVTGDRDPGYGSTAKMLGEAAVCLAKDKQGVQQGGGFWTPSYAMGDALRQRLIEHAGLTFERLS